MTSIDRHCTAWGFKLAVLTSRSHLGWCHRTGSHTLRWQTSHTCQIGPVVDWPACWLFASDVVHSECKHRLGGNGSSWWIRLCWQQLMHPAVLHVGVICRARQTDLSGITLSQRHLGKGRPRCPFKALANPLQIWTLCGKYHH